MINYHKLSKKHKIKYILYHVLLFLSIACMGVLSFKDNGFKLETNADKMQGMFGIILVGFVVIIAMLNRLSTLFKIKSFGLIIVFLMLLGIEKIIHPVYLTLGYVLIPIIIDDFIGKPIWKGIWYKHYDD